MGNICSPDQKLQNHHIRILEQNLKYSQSCKQFGINLDENLKQFIRQQGKQKKILKEKNQTKNEYNFYIYQHRKKLNHKQEQNVINKNRLIILKNEPQQNILMKGMIIYNDGIYVGDLMNNKANGNGKMSLYSFQLDQHFVQIMQLRMSIQGIWQNDQLKNGTLSYSQVQFYKWQKIGQQTRIIFLKKQDEIRYCKGIINLKACNNIFNLLEGQLFIEYKNGDTYEGEVLNGKKHTSNKIAVYTKLNKMEVFKGHYKNDVRNGRGRCEIKDSNHPKIIFVIQADWELGEIKNSFSLKYKKVSSNNQQLYQICNVNKNNQNIYNVQLQSLKNYFELSFSQSK